VPQALGPTGHIPIASADVSSHSPLREPWLYA